MRYQKIIIFLAYLYSVSAVANCDFSDFPLMDEMRVQIVMDGANYNNRPMMVRSYYVEVDNLRVIEYYQRKWKDRFDVTAFGIWDQITTLTDECMMTVQVAANTDNSSHGRLIISNPPTGNPEAALGDGVVAPAESVVVSDLRTDDGPKEGRVTMLTSSLSTSAILDFYSSEMPRHDWMLERAFNEGDHAVLVFKRGLDMTNVLVTPAGSMSQVLVNEVRVR